MSLQKSILVYVGQNTIYASCVLVSLVVSLSLWSEWHLILDFLPTRKFSFIALFLVAGGIIIGMVNFFVTRQNNLTTSWWIEHIRQSLLLYLAASLIILVLPPISEFGAEGPDIAARALVLLLIYAIFINAAFLYFRHRL